MAREPHSPSQDGPETLSQFGERFGQLSDRYEQAADPELEQRELPTAERAEDNQAREDAESAQESNDIWPGQESSSDFNEASQGASRPEEGQGRDSQQVGEDAPEHNLRPPPGSEDQDRSTHADRMARDDIQARQPMKPSYYDRLTERYRDAQNEQGLYGQDQSRDQGQDYEHSR